MITSRTPNARRRASVISNSVRPAISTRVFGRSFVSGRKRVPSPAARIMAFIVGLSLWGFHCGAFIVGLSLWGFHCGAFIGAPSFAQLLQLQMPHRYLYSICGAEMFCQLLGKIDRAVLAAGA